MKRLRDLVRTKKVKDSQKIDNLPENGSSSKVNFTDVIGDKITVYQKAYGESINALGNISIFDTCLNQLYQKFRMTCKENEGFQEAQRRPIKLEITKLTAEIEKREALLTIKNDKIDFYKDRINELDNDIDQVQIQPKKYGIDASKKPKAQFYIGLFILLPITAYLLVFYLSASYSAFFKDFETNKLAAAIFDAQAFTKAINDGMLEAVFVGTIPFVFMGLGYLLHMFQKEGAKGKNKTLALFAVTFLFDVILAYQIEKKIYEFEKTLASAPFDIIIALQTVEFWGIIFAGFVVYIIWGLVFDFVMKEYENFDKIKSFISNLIDQIKTAKSKIDELQHEILEIKTGTHELEEKLKAAEHSLSSIFISTKDYLEYHSEYTKGWMMGMQKELVFGVREKRALLEQTKDKSLTHLFDIGIISKEDDKMLDDYISELTHNN